MKKTTQDNIYTYSDLDFTFNLHPITKDLTTNKDDIAVRNSMRNLILTRHYEIFLHPEIGSNVFDTLFENSDRTVHSFMEKEIINVISNFEPRCKVNSVNVYTDMGITMIDIEYYLFNSTTTSLLKIPVKSTI